MTSLDEDRILRSFVGVIDATLRTSYTSTRKHGLRADGGRRLRRVQVRFLQGCRTCQAAPVPRDLGVRPARGGIHLRFGPVARGGLRWSDRREDFRTEVLGLVKAQMVKNTGDRAGRLEGRLLLQALADPATNRDAWFAEGVACYKPSSTACSTSPTTIVDGKIAPPARGPPRRRRSVPGGRRRQGHRDLSPTSPTASPRRTASGWTTPSPPAARSATTTRAWASPPAARGSRSAPFPRAGPRLPEAGLHLRRHRRHVRRRVRQRHAAVEAHPPGGRVRPPPHLPRSGSGRGEFVQGAQRLFRCRVPAGRTTTGADQQGGGVTRAARSRSSCRRCAPRSASKPTPPDDPRADQRDPQGAGRPAVGTAASAPTSSPQREQRRRRRPRQQRLRVNGDAARKVVARAATSA